MEEWTFGSSPIALGIKWQLLVIFSTMEASQVTC
jgi:hypothetical protein